LKNKKERGFCVYATLIVVVLTGDRAVGVSTLSHTNISAVNSPDASGIHDWAAASDSFAGSSPVTHDRDTVTPLPSFICTI
jgi:hypothetical protein